MSVERYYAICHPLRSRVWQTRSHALRLIGVLWLAGLVAASPTLVLSQLQPMTQGRYKCREKWPTPDLEKGYMIFIDLTYLVLPLIAMVVTFVSITLTLCGLMRNEQAGQQIIAQTSALASDSGHKGKTTTNTSDFATRPLCANSGDNKTNGTLSLRLRRSNAAKSLASKRRVILMLFVVVVEFFVCWTPVYIIITASLFYPTSVYRILGSGGISLCQAVSYTSACCNPITYCFMNSGFRQSFLAAFGCRKPPSRHDPLRTTTVPMRTLSVHLPTSRELSRGPARI